MTQPLITPWDDHNQRLVENTHPPDWTNPEPASRYNLVVLGAGTAGLVTAAAAAGLGARVALVERHLMGGDCLVTGCVPSKSLLRSAHLRESLKDSASLGVHLNGEATVDFSSIMERLRAVRASISPHDSAHRFRQLGVDVFLGEGRFTAPDAIEVNGKTLRFKKAVIATGGRPYIPPIPGLENVPYLTSETVFELTEQPRSLLVIGGGPIGCELGQAFLSLGTRVTLVERGERLLPREDADVAQILIEVMKRQGVDLRFHTEATQIHRQDGAIAITLKQGDQTQAITVDALLVSSGRAPNVHNLGLELAGVHFDERKGVLVDDSLRTSNPAVYAAGDVCLPYQFTHAADFAARTVIRNALFSFLPGKQKFSRWVIPWCTYTQPEIARVGISEYEAQQRQIAYSTYHRPLSEVDRALIDGENEGFFKILVQPGNGRILGAAIVSSRAGDLIGEITLAMAHNIPLGALGSVIHPYPTQSEAYRQAADAFNRSRLTPSRQKFLKRIFSWLR